MQAAIEFFNRETDEDNQSYYVDKLSRLNDQIREIVDRQNRAIQRKQTQKVPTATKVNPLAPTGHTVKQRPTSAAID